MVNQTFIWRNGEKLNKKFIAWSKNLLLIILFIEKMSNFSVLKSNKADSLIKNENKLDKIVQRKWRFHIHLSCNDNSCIPAHRHNDIYPLRNLQCKCLRFCMDYSSMVSICGKISEKKGIIFYNTIATNWKWE